jgi:hypothetical protein
MIQNKQKDSKKDAKTADQSPMTEAKQLKADQLYDIIIAGQ